MVMVNILVLCTGNSARSIMAEALLEYHGAGRITAFSAGSRPTGMPNPLALQQIAALGFPSERFRSKSWDEFSGPEAPRLDAVITVCGNAEAEVCPVWSGTPVRAHWGFPDPAGIQGDEGLRQAAFAAVYRGLEACVSRLLAQPIEDLAPAELLNALQQAAPLKSEGECAQG